jgi:hypothetical protein
MGRGAVLYFARAGSRWTDREGGCACGGRWMVTADFTGTPIYFQLELTQEDEKLGGKSFSPTRISMSSCAAYQFR